MDKFKISDELPYRAGSLLLTSGSKSRLTVLYPAIIFIPDTHVRVTLSFFSEQSSIPGGHLFLLPPEIEYTLSCNSDTELFYLEVPDLPFLYIHHFADSVKQDPVNVKQLFVPLKITGMINNFVSCISFYLREKLTAPNLIGLKAVELLSLINHYYSAEKVHSFFTPILSDDYKFVFFVLTHHQNVSSAKELAALSSYSIVHFERVFKKIFNQPPYQWMLQRKIRYIYEEVKNTSKPLKLIADQYGFASMSNFGDFCRKHFGETPSQLRKKVDV